MKTNPVKDKLLKGNPAYGVFGWEFLVPGLPQIVKAAGVEYLLIDMEHAGTSYETVKEQVAQCRGIDLIPMARVPANQYTFIARALDLGAMGIMVPMVGSAEEAQHIVSCTRYPPTGRRGAAFGFAHDDYLGGDLDAKIRTANERTLVMCLIETEEGIRNIDSIAAVPGVDVLWLGHFDLSNFLGIPGRFDHPKYLKAVDRLVHAAQAHGKVLACMCGDDRWNRDYWARGFRLWLAGIDIFLLQEALRRNVKALRDLEQASEKPQAGKKKATR
jgi:2-keto-3-deoxy-L-rhamnonate aldolase RhmA